MPIIVTDKVAITPDAVEFRGVRFTANKNNPDDPGTKIVAILHAAYAAQLAGAITVEMRAEELRLCQELYESLHGVKH